MTGNGSSWNEGDSYDASGSSEQRWAESRLQGATGYDEAALASLVPAVYVGSPGIGGSSHAPPTIAFTLPPPIGMGEETGSGNQDHSPADEETWGHFFTGLIPIYGSARDAYEQFSQGHLFWGTVNVGLLALDLASVGAVGMGIKAVAKGGVKGLVSAAKSEALGTIEAIGTKSLQLAKGAADNIGAALWDDAAEGAGKLADDLLEAADGLGQVDDLLLQRLKHGADVDIPAGTNGIRKKMSDLTLVSGNEVALLRLQSGRRVMRMGGSNSVPIGKFVKAVIAHTHPRGSLKYSLADLAVLKRLGQESSALIDPNVDVLFRMSIF